MYTFESLRVLWDTGNHGTAETGGMTMPVIVCDVVTAADSIDDISTGSHRVRFVQMKFVRNGVRCKVWGVGKMRGGKEGGEATFDSWVRSYPVERAG